MNANEMLVMYVAFFNRLRAGEVVVFYWSVRNFIHLALNCDCLASSYALRRRARAWRFSGGGDSLHGGQTGGVGGFERRFRKDSGEIASGGCGATAGGAGVDSQAVRPDGTAGHGAGAAHDAAGLPEASVHRRVTGWLYPIPGG